MEDVRVSGFSSADDSQITTEDPKMVQWKISQRSESRPFNNEDGDEAVDQSPEVVAEGGGHFGSHWLPRLLGRSQPKRRWPLQGQIYECHQPARIRTTQFVPKCLRRSPRVVFFYAPSDRTKKRRNLSPCCWTLGSRWISCRKWAQREALAHIGRIYELKISPLQLWCEFPNLVQVLSKLTVKAYKTQIWQLRWRTMS